MGASAVMSARYNRTMSENMWRLAYRAYDGARAFLKRGSGDWTMSDEMALAIIRMLLLAGLLLAVAIAGSTMFTN